MRHCDPDTARDAKVCDGVGSADSAADTADASEFDDFAEILPAPSAYDLVRRYPDGGEIRHREQVRYHASPEEARSWLTGIAQTGAKRMGAEYGLWTIEAVYS